MEKETKKPSLEDLANEIASLKREIAKYGVRVDKISTWNPKPGDVLLVRIEGMPHPRDLAAIQDLIQKLLEFTGLEKGSIESLVYTKTLKFEIIRKESKPN